jgi:hypothetical protein
VETRLCRRGRAGGRALGRRAEVRRPRAGQPARALGHGHRGKRSALAAEAAAKAGFTQVFNVLEGFEGEIDERQQRGGSDGWRFHGLPWIQD